MTNRHPETNILISLFKEKAESGLTVTYEEMSKAIGRNIHKYRYRVQSAIAFLQEDYGYVSRCIPSVGYEFLRTYGIAEHESRKFRDKVNNHVDRFNNKLSTIEYQKLSSSELQQAITASIISSSVKLMVGDEFFSKTKEIAGRCPEKSNTVDYINSAKEAIKALWHVS